MGIFAIGLNHKTAPIGVREPLSFSQDEAEAMLAALRERFEDSEFVILSTCNRAEIYCVGHREDTDRGYEVAVFWAEYKGLIFQDIETHLYIHTDAQAVRHVLRVASSLDSMVVGESQIIGQVKEGYRIACACKSTGKVLNRLFHTAFATAKEIYATTSITRGRVSVAGVAVELAAQLFTDVASTKAVVVGAGEMGELLIQHLLQMGCTDVTLVNRSFDRAVKVAQQYGIQAQPWERLTDELIQTQVVIAAASVREALFDKAAFKAILEQRHHKTLMVVDIAIPRNFDPAINDFEDVYVFSIDDLSSVAEKNRAAREQDTADCLKIIDVRVKDFMGWFETHDLGPHIGLLRETFARISREEMSHFFVGVRKDAACRGVLEPAVKRIVNKLLHCVIKNVDTVAKEQGASKAVVLVDHLIAQAEQISESNGDKSKEETAQ